MVGILAHHFVILEHFLRQLRNVFDVTSVCQRSSPWPWNWVKFECVISIFLVHNLCCGECIELTYQQVSRLSIGFVVQVLTFSKREYELWQPEFVSLSSDRWLKIKVTGRKAYIRGVYKYTKFFRFLSSSALESDYTFVQPGDRTWDSSEDRDAPRLDNMLRYLSLTWPNSHRTQRRVIKRRLHTSSSWTFPWMEDQLWARGGLRGCVCRSYCARLSTYTVPIYTCIPTYGAC